MMNVLKFLEFRWRDFLQEVVIFENVIKIELREHLNINLTLFLKRI